MYNSTTVAWGVPCSAAKIGAQVQTYVESKPTITAFRICVRDGQIQGAPVGRLPEELIRAVSEFVKTSLLQSHRRDWKKGIRCCEGKCQAIDHFGADEREELYSAYRNYMDDDSLSDEELNEILIENGDYYCEHLEQQGTFLCKLGEMSDGSGKPSWFSRYNKVIAEDFGLQVVFASFIVRDPDQSSILAHLVVPSHHTEAMVSCSELGFSSLSAMILDPASLQPLSADTKTRFHLAMKTLELRPFLHRLHRRSSYPTNMPFPNVSESKKVKSKEEIDSIMGSEWPKLIVLASVVEDC